jgi:hypothetical protein
MCNAVVVKIAVFGQGRHQVSSASVMTVKKSFIGAFSEVAFEADPGAKTAGFGEGVNLGYTVMAVDANADEGVGYRVVRSASGDGLGARDAAGSAFEFSAAGFGDKVTVGTLVLRGAAVGVGFAGASVVSGASEVSGANGVADARVVPGANVVAGASVIATSSGWFRLASARGMAEFAGSRISLVSGPGTDDTKDSDGSADMDDDAGCDSGGGILAASGIGTVGMVDG